MTENTQVQSRSALKGCPYIEDIVTLLDEGKTTREIGEILGKGRSVISYHMDKYGVKDHSKFAMPIWNETAFSTVDTEEKAYVLGFLLGDGSVHNSETGFSLELALSDKCVCDFITSIIGGNVKVSHTYKPESRTFPRARFSCDNRSICTDLRKLFCLRKKEDRKIPIIRKELEPALVRGFFDADGCITWGYRKDRNRLWHKTMFTSQLNLLTGIQSILIKSGISSIIRPKKGERCFVLEICNREMVTDFMNYVYPSGCIIVLPRKFEKVQALRRELGENGETYIESVVGNTVPSLLY